MIKCCYSEFGQSSPPFAVPQDLKFGLACGIFARYHRGSAKLTISRSPLLLEAKTAVVQLECSEGLLIAAFRISRHFSCLKQGCWSSADQLTFLIFASQVVVAFQDCGELSASQSTQLAAIARSYRQSSTFRIMSRTPPGTPT